MSDPTQKPPVCEPIGNLYCPTPAQVFWDTAGLCMLAFIAGVAIAFLSFYIHAKWGKPVEILEFRLRKWLENRRIFKGF